MKFPRLKDLIKSGLNLVLGRRHVLLYVSDKPGQTDVILTPSMSPIVLRQGERLEVVLYLEN